MLPLWAGKIFIEVANSHPILITCESHFYTKMFKMFSKSFCMTFFVRRLLVFVLLHTWKLFVSNPFNLFIILFLSYQNKNILPYPNARIFSTKSRRGGIPHLRFLFSVVFFLLIVENLFLMPAFCFVDKICQEALFESPSIEHQLYVCHNHLNISIKIGHFTNGGNFPQNSSLRFNRIEVRSFPKNTQKSIDLYKKRFYLNEIFVDWREKILF